MIKITLLERFQNQIF